MSRSRAFTQSDDDLYIIGSEEVKMKPKILLSSGLFLPSLLIMCLVLNVCGEKSKMSLSDESMVAFVNVSVIPMDNERILERHTVIVKNGLIEKIGPTGEIRDVELCDSCCLSEVCLGRRCKGVTEASRDEICRSHDIGHVGSHQGFQV